jgi:hypothetical protein
MLTPTAQLPNGLAASGDRFTPTNGSRGSRCHPTKASRRTRHDFLHMLVGADGGRFPRIPRRRTTW